MSGLIFAEQWCQNIRQTQYAFTAHSRRLDQRIQPFKPVLACATGELIPVDQRSLTEGTGSMIITASFKRSSIFAAAVVLSLTITTTAFAACSDPASRGVDWSGCNKSGTDLKGAFLTAAMLQDTNLSNANLSGAALQDAILTGADLTGANLTGADLFAAELPNAILTGADLTGVNLTGAGLSYATWTDGKKICAQGSVGECK